MKTHDYLEPFKEEDETRMDKFRREQRTVRLIAAAVLVLFAGAVFGVLSLFL